jgi:orotate phosphoribosyltransferase
MEQRKVLELLSRVGAVITNSHLVYTSGKHGAVYVNKDAVFPELLESSQLARAMAREFVHDNVEVVIGPAVGGALLARDVARALENLTERKVRPVYAEKSEKEDIFVIKRGYNKIVSGKNVLVVEDVLTTGGSAKKTVQATRACDGNVIGLAVICNRGGITPADVANPPKLYALINLKLEAWDEADCPLCAQNVPINTEVGKGREFVARQQKAS